ncbi:MAG: hypothetical protein KF685_10435 [Acidobacteria bacterium]|nr:hypothetical protein [Acidobacteriota bacterium]
MKKQGGILPPKRFFSSAVLLTVHVAGKVAERSAKDEGPYLGAKKNNEKSR